MQQLSVIKVNTVSVMFTCYYNFCDFIKEFCDHEQVDSLLSKKPGTPDKLFYWYYSIEQNTMKVINNH